VKDWWSLGALHMTVLGLVFPLPRPSAICRAQPPRAVDVSLPKGLKVPLPCSDALASKFPGPSR